MYISNNIFAIFNKFNSYNNKKMNKLSASEAVYGFCGWLTTREKETKMGSKNNCAVVADLANEFCKENKLEEPREHWANILIHPSGRISD